MNAQEQQEQQARVEALANQMQQDSLRINFLEQVLRFKNLHSHGKALAVAFVDGNSRNVFYIDTPEQIKKVGLVPYGSFREAMDAAVAANTARVNAPFMTKEQLEAAIESNRAHLKNTNNQAKALTNALRIFEDQLAPVAEPPVKKSRGRK